jgi:hypothetical protein
MKKTERRQYRVEKGEIYTYEICGNVVSISKTVKRS